MNSTNTNITWQGKPLKVHGAAIRVGQVAPIFRLVNSELKDVTLNDFSASNIILSVVPSLDTSTCALQTKRFNTEALGLSNDTRIITVSLDLPFAQKRWCQSEGCDRIITLSDYKYRSFGEQYGVYIEQLGLLTRAIFVIDRAATVRYVDYIPNISDEPKYDDALTALAQLSARAA